jgi:LmbE family N-acetylglucosaminyl deacetylase
VTLTSAAKTVAMLERSGLAAREVAPEETGYRDQSLIQHLHGNPPDVFHVEGVRVPAVLFAPHNDDEALFASFTILRHRPRVVVCYPSVRDYGDPAVREAESRDALQVLGASGFEQWAGGDVVAGMRALDERSHPSIVWAPDLQTSHREHLAVARAAREVFGERVRTYHTYDKDGKVRVGRLVSYEPEWVHAKLRALARYTTQATHPRASQFFTADLLEYEGA